jgi:hypothetical protein
MREMFSYYGRLSDKKSLRPFYHDLINEGKRYMMSELKEMEDRLKRHITECKREIIKKLCPKEFKKSPTKPKEKSNGSQSKRKY